MAKNAKIPPIVIYLVQIVAAVVGTITSLYLLVQHTRLASGIQDGASFCSLSKHMDCDVVNASAFSEVMGVPMASLGAFYYFLLFLLIVCASPSNRNFARIQQMIAWLCVLGLGFDLFLLAVQVFHIQTLCLLCLVTYLMTLLIVLSAIALAGPKISHTSHLTSLFSASGAEKLSLKPSTIVLLFLSLITFTAVLVFVPDSIRKNSEVYARTQKFIRQFYDQWKSLPTKRIPIKESDGSYGNPDAKIKIVEFSDFQCPHCRKMAFNLHTALPALKNRVHFVFKHYPLDPDCNNGIRPPGHAHACKLARLAYCASKKGSFWDYHDLVFFKLTEKLSHSNWQAWQQALDPIFSEAEIAQCLKSADSLRNTREDLTLGRSLQLRGTPTVYINGKTVIIPLTVETLNKLVELEEILIRSEATDKSPEP